MCETGRFGDKCQSNCHCDEDANCDSVTGECPDNVCAPGWKGNTCSEGKEKT